MQFVQRLIVEYPENITKRSWNYVLYRDFMCMPIRVFQISYNIGIAMKSNSHFALDLSFAFFSEE